MRIVLIHPITRAPLDIEPQYGQPMYFTGNYQNVALVPRKWWFVNGVWKEVEGL